MNDYPAYLHHTVYGRSDKANAPENCNAEFQDGYNTGRDFIGDGLDRIIVEAIGRGQQTDSPELAEWKRGFYAARTQKEWATFCQGQMP